ncbi:hypothetical protein A2U01_0040761 [Trifolium medium]|uniref:Uncharacterized protein n=1 Tax=Trifolium medium TaxID=97028 RepID=A0A392Q5D2_9FABA|nr:hypothetical protein [Trifolium medium]
MPQSQQTTLHHEAGSQHNEPKNGTQTPIVNNGTTNGNTNGHINGNNNIGNNRNNGTINCGQGEGPPSDDSDDDNSSRAHSPRDKDNRDNIPHRKSL